MEQAPVTTNRRLQRGDGPLTGVAAGMADYFGIDPVIVRLGLVATTILGGPTVPVVYLAAWLIIPAADAGPEAPVAPSAPWATAPPPAPAPAPAPTAPAPADTAPEPAGSVDTMTRTETEVVDTDADIDLDADRADEAAPTGEDENR